ncbi:MULTISPECIES: hypothetical protein [unclassified Rhodococcus (in: high G+C Gram-positive bacteria)]|uniref:hypothetical protein n=1 Tax=unclassified Rhodococcus (in: high G+C Gram-positive bacteria) TaxID=192944 RepID=UPI00092ABAF6|nr:hypothetical protein [Rhodococcus sp. M8]OLL16306.1 hypothetical protein BKE56_023155 [Rhodococcus sp. M8]QPG46376.1 hypothetical protein ISO16_04790 [Rhodococcus sp. M8]
MSSGSIEGVPAGELLIVGDCSRVLDGARGAELRTWARHHGLGFTYTFAPGRVVCAIVTEEVLDGACSPAEAMTMQSVRAAGIPCVCVHDAPERILEALVEHDLFGDTVTRSRGDVTVPAGTVCTSVFALNGDAGARRDPQPA